MKKLFAVVSAVFLTLFLLTGCGMSTEDLAKEVKANMAEKFRSDPLTRNVEVVSLTLVHKSGNQYAGIAKLREGLETQDVNVEVTCDGDSFMWRIK